MCREIEFRGKRIDNGEWVHGDYFKTPLTDEATGSKPEDGWYFLTGRERHCISKNNCVYEVNPETVGQYTNNNTWSSQRVYDGDYVKDDDGIIYEVVWKDDQWMCKDKNGWIGLSLNWVLGDGGVVVGNIHEKDKV